MLSPRLALLAAACAAAPVEVDLSLLPADFYFGTATAAYQIEGAAAEGGRGPSIWDAFSHTPGATANGDTGDVACDHYHRFGEDVELMAQLGVREYRLSFAWPRLMPDGTIRSWNAEGARFYHRLLDALDAKNITPLVTLYHWDLPLALDDGGGESGDGESGGSARGGWLDARVVGDFERFATACFDEFGARVRRWATFNEPFTFIRQGYSTGVHAPGRCTSCEAGGDSAVEPCVFARRAARARARGLSLSSRARRARGARVASFVDRAREERRGAPSSRRARGF